jgi:anti-anti-sigma regulatory factor
MDFNVTTRDSNLKNGQRAVIVQVVGEVDGYTAPRMKDTGPEA